MYKYINMKLTLKFPPCCIQSLYRGSTSPRRDITSSATSRTNDCLCGDENAYMECLAELHRICTLEIHTNTNSIDPIY